jgi:hypothetical protein
LIFDQPWCKRVIVVLVTVSWERREQLENGVVVVDSHHTIMLVEEKIGCVNWVLGKFQSVWKCIHCIRKGVYCSGEMQTCALVSLFMLDIFPDWDNKVWRWFPSYNRACLCRSWLAPVEGNCANINVWTWFADTSNFLKLWGTCLLCPVTPV